MTLASEARDLADDAATFQEILTAGKPGDAWTLSWSARQQLIAFMEKVQKEAGRAEAMASLEIDGMRDVICALDGFMATGRRPRGAAWTRVARARTALANIRNGSAPTPEPPSEKETEGDVRSD